MNYKYEYTGGRNNYLSRNLFIGTAGSNIQGTQSIAIGENADLTSIYVINLPSITLYSFCK